MAKNRDRKSELEQSHEFDDEIEEEPEVVEQGPLEQPACPRCGWHDTRLSHTSGALDPILRLFRLRAYRCRSCGNRFRAFRRSRE